MKFDKIYITWALIDIRSPNECWPWKGELNNGGYGPHRRIYESLNGPLTDNKVVMHCCNNPSCCNPNHLLAGTQSDNILWAEFCGRRDHTKTSLTVRRIKQGTGVCYHKRSDSYQIQFKVFGRWLYVQMCKDATLAYILGKAALAEVEKLLRTRQGLTYDDVKRHFHANS